MNHALFRNISPDGLFLALTGLGGDAGEAALLPLAESVPVELRFSSLEEGAPGPTVETGAGSTTFLSLTNRPRLGLMLAEATDPITRVFVCLFTFFAFVGWDLIGISTGLYLAGTFGNCRGKCRRIIVEYF